MAHRQRKDKKAASPSVPLSQPDRSAPTDETLLDMANERNLFAQADEKMRRNGVMQEKWAAPKVDPNDTISPAAERVIEAVLWTSSLAMLHFTFDLLVQHQYGESIDWEAIWWRAGGAWIAFLVLFYPLHPHISSSTLLPGLAPRFQRPLRQSIFFAMSISAGCSLIYVTNTSSYVATMKRAPALGCFWLWSVVELDLVWAASSLLCAAGFLMYNGFEIK